MNASPPVQPRPSILAPRVESGAPARPDSFRVGAAVVALLVWRCVAGAHAQNVVTDGAFHETAAPLTIPLSMARLIQDLPAPDPVSFDQPGEGARVARKLDSHVREFLEGHPWMPFHHTLGISGYEAVFDHPDEMFHSLSLALPFLQEETARQTRRLLRSQLESSPPWDPDGWDRRTGRPRESYRVPESLRLRGRGRANGAFGAYAFWSYCHLANDPESARRYWPEVKEWMRPLLANPYAFDIEKRDYANDEAERLNGNLAGLIGLARLARLVGDSSWETRATERARELLSLRVNLERVNPQIVERTHSSSKHLHNYKLARYCDLTPEIGHALRGHTDGLAPLRVKTFRELRNGWFLAFGDRFIGGENHTNPLNFPRAVFAGAALIEHLPGDQLASFLDVPWCPGDFYFIERSAYALQSLNDPKGVSPKH